MKEIWKDIKDYEGLYQVSNLGRVKSLKKNKILKGLIGEYIHVVLYKENTRKNKKVHRLVAENFINNINNYDCINHKDENKFNNNVNNLEWCSKKYNCNYGIRNEKMSKTKSQYKIVQKDKNEQIVKIWNNVWDLRNNTSYNINVIRQCCKGKCKSVYGYKWEYTFI